MFKISFLKYVRFNFLHEYLRVREGLRANLCKKYMNKPFNFQSTHKFDNAEVLKAHVFAGSFLDRWNERRGSHLRGRGGLNHTTLYLLPKIKNCDKWSNVINEINLKNKSKLVSVNSLKVTKIPKWLERGQGSWILLWYLLKKNFFWQNWKRRIGETVIRFKQN